MVTMNACQTAKTQFVEGDGIRYAYRVVGDASSPPLIFCHRFRGNMDDWDPLFVNTIAEKRQVILFDNAGIGLSSGQPESTVQGMAKHAANVIRLLGFKQVDALGFSMGGYVAQTLALDYPELIRRVILAGTGSGGGEGYQPATPEIRQIAARPVLGLEEFTLLFFENSETSQRAALEYWERLKERKEDLDVTVNADAVKAQLSALVAWGGGQGSATPRLAEIRQPVLVANGSNDVMVPTPNSWLMATRIKNAQLIIYPDSGHGFLFQYAERFGRACVDFLE